MGKLVFKAHDDRLSSATLESDPDDPELLLHVPFTAEVKISSFCIISSGDTAPKRVRLFVNRENVDFSNVKETKEVQAFDLTPDSKGVIEYPVQ